MSRCSLRQSTDCKLAFIHGLSQAAASSYFTANFRRGWPVLQNDWTELFGSHQADKKGHKVWMMASDGSRQSGPYGAKCWNGHCSQGEFVGKRIGYHWAFLARWKDGGQYDRRDCLKEAFHDGIRYFDRLENKILDAEKMAECKWKSKHAVSCQEFYAPELPTTQLELGLSPDAEIPEGWVQYPLDKDKYGTVWGRGWVEQQWARRAVQYPRPKV